MAKSSTTIAYKKLYIKQWRRDHPDNRKEYDSQYNNSDAHREANRRYRQTKKGKEVALEARHRYMARQAGLQHDLTAEEWEYIKSRHPICLRCGKTFSQEMQPTLDHIIPVSRGGGYTKLNIRPLCFVCNVKKGNKMDFLRLRVKVMENFKDGNVLNGKFLRAGEILMVSESDYTKVINSGGILEILETMVPNPRVVEAVKVEEVAPEVVEEQKTAPKRRGRPKKNEA